MMEMEMNADLGDDVESESGESSSEGSSASSTFCSLEKDYARVAQEMKSNEALAAYEPEYTKLFRKLYRAHRVEKELLERIRSLTEELEERSEKVFELRRGAAADASEMESLKQRLDEWMRLADAAHTRELNAQDTIENLRLSTKKLTNEIEQRNKQLAAVEFDADGGAGIGQQKNGLPKERDRLLAELDILREQLRNTSRYADELEKKVGEMDRDKCKLQETIEMQENELSRMGKFGENVENELQQLREQLAKRDHELEVANASLRIAARDAAKAESLLKDSKTAEEKARSQLRKLTSRTANLESEVANATARLEGLERQLSEKEKERGLARQEVRRLEEDCGKLTSESKSLERKVVKCEAERSKLETEVKRLERTARSAASEIEGLRRARREEQLQREGLIREKSALARTKESLQERVARASRELALVETARRRVNEELGKATQAANEAARKLAIVERERDRCVAEAQELAQRVDEGVAALQLNRLDLLDGQKRLAAMEAKHRQQQSLFEAVRAERDERARALAEAQEEIRSLRSKARSTGHRVEQLTEDVAAKEADVVRQQFLVGRAEKEKDGLRSAVERGRKETTALRAELGQAAEAARRSRDRTRRAEAEIARQRKNIDEATNERDVLGTQLVRRNDELALQCDRARVLEGELRQAEARHNRTLDDLRLLKLEISKLRTEKARLGEAVAGTGELRREVLRLAKDLTRERLKVTALEEEVQTPVNVHRWRKLEGTDPDTYDLSMKIQILQKRVLNLSADSFDKERKMRDCEKLYVHVRDVLSRQPGPPASVALRQTRNALRERGRRIKCLVSEINLQEMRLNEYKFETESSNKELGELKAKYYEQKRRLERRGARPKARSANEIHLPPVPASVKKFRGGGFAVSAPTLLTD